MPLKLELANHGDVSGFIDALWAAFKQPYEPYVDLVYPGFNPTSAVPDQDAALARMKSEWKMRWRDNAREFWLKVIDEDTGRIIAGTKLTIFEKNVYEETDPVYPPAPWLPEGSKKRKYAEFIQRQKIDRYRERCRVPHILINQFFTMPEYRGRGAGAMMLKWVSDRADVLGCDAFVESTDIGEPVYRRAGFLPVGSFYTPRIESDDAEMAAIQDQWPWRSLFMWRPSKINTWSSGKEWPWEVA